MGRRRVALQGFIWLALLLGTVVLWLVQGTAANVIITAVSAVGTFRELLALLPSRFAQRSRRSTPSQVDKAEEALARAVLAEWKEEARSRRLGASDFMPVHWEISQHSRSSPPSLPQTGDMRRLVSELAAAPQSAIVLGEPGSGKTGLCVNLTLEFLRQATRAYVPVLLPISSWRPEVTIQDWMCRRLTEDYDFLANEAEYGSNAVSELIAQHRILPILDGLDELPEAHLGPALAAIRDDLGADSPFILTCRNSEFAAATRTQAPPRVTIVRLLPMTPQAVASYLQDIVGSARPEDDWRQVRDRLEEEPDGPLAVTLTNPLMLYLARMAYERTGAVPPALAQREKALSHEQMREQLLDVYLSSVFGTRRGAGQATGTRLSRRWDPGRADRWLTFLATHLTGRGTRNLDWWQLHLAVPRWFVVLFTTLVGSSVCCFLGWLMFAIFGRPALGAMLGLIIGLAGGVTFAVVPVDRPRRLVRGVHWRNELAYDILRTDVGFAAIGMVTGGLVVGLIYSVGQGMVVGLVCGVVFGLVRRFTAPSEPDDIMTPARALRSDRLVNVFAAVCGGAVGAAAGGYFGGVVGAVGSVPAALTERIHGPLEAGALGASVGLLLGAVGLGMLVHATGASGRFHVSLLWLVPQGAVPVRLMAFLDDAYRLGVLRQVGPHYQFHHESLQERLAAPGRRRPASSVISPVERDSPREPASP